MKKFASLLLITVIALTAATKVNAQATKYREYTATAIATSNFVSQISTVTTQSNWGSELSSAPSPAIPGNTHLFAQKMEVASGSLPSFSDILSAEYNYFLNGAHAFPGCGIKISNLPVPLTGGGTKNVDITFTCQGQ